MDELGEVRAGGGGIHADACAGVGGTPLVRLQRLPAAAGCRAEILAKLEPRNPSCSIKDRVALAMIAAAEAQGLLGPGTLIVEATAGNTGVALAFVCAARGYRLALTMPENIPAERRKLLRLLGAELHFTPARHGMRGAIERAQRLRAGVDGAVLLNQFENPANVAAHRTTTAAEIWRATGGRLDGLVAGVGTGGTITGCGEVLKEHDRRVRIVAVEPESSPVLSGGRPGRHKIQGIGAGFVPPNLKREVIDEVVAVANHSAFATARATARAEGLLVGISSGAALAAALEVGARPDMAGARIVVIVASAAERYANSELFAER